LLIRLFDPNDTIVSRRLIVSLVGPQQGLFGARSVLHAIS
jgi:hypothetical protein